MENAGASPHRWVNTCNFRTFLGEWIFLRFPVMPVARGRAVRFDDRVVGGGKHEG
jgi:hypothetical protein